MSHRALVMQAEANRRKLGKLRSVGRSNEAPTMRTPPLPPALLPAAPLLLLPLNN